MARKTPVLLQDQYIAEHVSNGGRKARAARKLEIPWSTLMGWFKDDADFRARLEQAESDWYDELRYELLRRAKEKSDTLGIFFMKSRFPEAYDDEIRRAKWLKDTGTESPDAANVNVFLQGEPAPEGIGEPMEYEPTTEH